MWFSTTASPFIFDRLFLFSSLLFSLLSKLTVRFWFYRWNGRRNNTTPQLSRRVLLQRCSFTRKIIYYPIVPFASSRCDWRSVHCTLRCTSHRIASHRWYICLLFRTLAVSRVFGSAVWFVALFKDTNAKSERKLIFIASNLKFGSAMRAVIEFLLFAESNRNERP